MTRIPPSEIHYAEDGLYYRGKEPFTGFTFTTYPGGEPRSEVEFRDGHRWGLARGWYPNGQLIEEIPFREGAVHGIQREWEKDGTLVSEEECEYGIVLVRRELQDGEFVETYRLSEEENNYALLQRFRELYRADGG